MTASLDVRASIISGLLFLLVGSPFAYKLVQRLLGGIITTASAEGCPTTAGLIIHAGVFALLTYLLMQVGKKRKEMLEPEATPDVVVPVVVPVVAAPQL